MVNGTIRSNVDPFNEYPDEDIISALKKVQIWDQLKISQGKANVPADNNKPTKGKKKSQHHQTVEMVPMTEEQQKLTVKISDGGSNFSLGQRQLICMARAIVRKNKVLLMDEATASIDELTDHLIQKMIKTEFKDTTVITIAHRLITIAQYDRIMVMSEGKIVEFDTPLNLMKNENSYFAKLVKESGPEFEKRMIALAENKDSEII